MLRKAIYLGDNAFNALQARNFGEKVFFCPAGNSLKKGDAVMVEDTDIVSNEITGSFMIRGGKNVEKINDGIPEQPKTPGIETAATT